MLSQVGGPDANGDGIPDIGDYVLGINPTSSQQLVPGISNIAALQDGLVGNSYLLNTTGIVASLPLQGEAQAVVLVGSTTNTAQQTAYVATGSYGLAIVKRQQLPGTDGAQSY